MNILKSLTNKYVMYALSGIVAGVAVSSLLLLHRYDNYLDTRLDEMNNIIQNKAKIKKQIQDMESVVKHFRDELNLDAANVNAEAYIFRALDEMKTRLSRAKIKVDTFKDEGGYRSMPVTIMMPVENYAVLVNHIQYVESFTIPKFKIDNFSVVRGHAKSIILDMRGKFLMPSL
jgi:hypothetical protein